MLQLTALEVTIMSESKKLTKHDITMLGIRSSFLQASFNYERMQACGFLWSMLHTLARS